VSLRGEGTSTGVYGVYYDTSTLKFSGYAWGSDIAGWISFCDESINGRYCVQALGSTLESPQINSLTPLPCVTSGGGGGGGGGGGLGTGPSGTTSSVQYDCPVRIRYTNPQDYDGVQFFKFNLNDPSRNNCPDYNLLRCYKESERETTTERIESRGAHSVILKRFEASTTYKIYIKATKN
jgi:hypothetical protein